MNKIILHPGQKLTIEIKGKPAGGKIIKSSKAAPSGGLIKSRRPSDYPKRRRRMGSLINFYDLGEYLSSGVWIDDDRRITPTLTDLNDTKDDPLESGLFPLFADQIKDKYNLPLSVLPGSWKTTFRKIGYEIADEYDLDYAFDEMPEAKYAVTENPNWTAAGMKFNVKPQNYIAIGQDPRYDKSPVTARFYTYQKLFSYINLPDSSTPATIKITSSPAFASDEVEFADVSLEIKPFEVYFNRLMYFSNATVRQYNSGEAYTLILNAFFYVLTKEMSVSSDYNVVRNYSDFKLMLIDSVQMASRISGARQLKQPNYGSGVFDYEDDGTPSSFFLDGTPYDGPILMDEYFNSGIVQRVVTPSGSLLAAINQGAKWFYIWRA